MGSGTRRRWGVVPIDAPHIDLYRDVMPSAGDFAAAVTQLQRSLTVIDDTRVLVARVRQQPALIGGPIAQLVTAGIEQSADELLAIRRLGDDVIAELDRRRVACERYAADTRIWRSRYSRWEADDRAYRVALGADGAIWPGPAPVRPSPPFPGAEPS